MTPRSVYPDDEARHAWLTTLLDSYAIADAVNTELLAECSRRHVTIACSKGCDHCCRNPNAPVSELELKGITWFVTEQLAGPERDQVAAQLRDHRTTSRCPLLVDGACAVRPVRPLICRQFFMRNRPCGPNEDIMRTRPQDVVLPRKNDVKRVAMRLLEYYGITKPAAKARAFDRGFIAAHSNPMHEHDWATVAQQMGSSNSTKAPT